MKKETCLLEESLRAALAEKRLDPELRDHASSCPVCRDGLMISVGMRTLRDATLSEWRVEANPQDARKIWNLAQTERVASSDIVRKSLKPIMIYRKIAWSATLLMGAYLLLWHSSQIKNLLFSLSGLRTIFAFLSSFPSRSESSSVRLILLAAGLGLVTMAVLVWVTRSDRAKS